MWKKWKSVSVFIGLLLLVFYHTITQCDGLSDDFENLYGSSQLWSWELLKNKQNLGACLSDAIPLHTICHGRGVRWMAPINQSYIHGNVLAVRRNMNISSCQQFCQTTPECQGAILRKDNACELMSTNETKSVKDISTVLTYECCTEEPNDETCISPMEKQPHKACPTGFIKWYSPIPYLHVNSSYLGRKRLPNITACQQFCYTTPGCSVAYFRTYEMESECFLMSSTTQTNTNISLLTYECCSPEEIFRFHGLSAVPLSLNEKYAIDWNSSEFVMKPKLVWDEMVRKEGNSTLHFPPFTLSLSDNTKRMIFMFLRREDEDLFLYGGCYHFHESSTVSINLYIMLNVTVINREGEHILWVLAVNVTMKCQSETKGDFLTGMSSLPWDTFANEKPPRVQFSFHQNPIYQMNGVPSVTLAYRERYFVDWNVIKSMFNYQSEWREMLKQKKNTFLEFPLISLQSLNETTDFIYFYFYRKDNHLHLDGGMLFRSKVRTTLEVSFSMTVQMTNKDGSRSDQSVNITTSLSYVIGTNYQLIHTFKDLPWNELSSTNAPRVSIMFF